MPEIPTYPDIHCSAGGPAISWVGFGTFNIPPADDVTQEVLRLQAQDGAWTRGYLYMKGTPDTVLCFIHPRGEVSTHYAFPKLTANGYATFGHQSRYFNNDTACIHEYLMADIAAAVTYLRERKGFRRVILVGNSGGGSLYTLYQAQASIAPPGRITHTVGGESYDLNALDMPMADGLILLAAHLGEGRYILNSIDPSVTDENDPLSCEPSLDMYNPDNGYVPLPAPSHYAPEFIERYRAAQLARIRRLDAIARQRIEARRYYQRALASPDLANRPARDRALIERRASADRYMIVYRTEADLAFCDPSLSPSGRKLGSILSSRPDIGNYRIGGFANCTIPEAWLSTWSALSSHGSMVDNLREITIPTLFVNFAEDACVFPDQYAEMFKCCAAADKSKAQVEGDHYGISADGSTRGRELALDVMIIWLTERFPLA